jgi:2-amino-4-hydroxy-6-hydroxymethyldihydropteridine diphosphokinase
VCLAQQRTITVLAKSSLYRTAPVDAGGDDYFNCVVKIETSLPARQLLRLCHTVEEQFGRERPYRNAPRTLDLDILLYGDSSIDEADLIVPHPRLTERAFVLVPLIELDVELVIPLRGRADEFLDAVKDQRIEKVATCQCPMLAAQRATSDAPSTASNKPDTCR